MAGVAAAGPGQAVLRSLNDRPILDCTGRIYCIAVGKAALGMARAAISRLAPDETLVVTNYENDAPLAGAQVMLAGHPVPDENGIVAGCAVEKMLAVAGENDHVLVLISGGGSALLPAPLPGLGLNDKAAVNRLLLGAGLDITAMNLVRQQLSRLKGGGFLRLANPAPVTALILSDVVGDDLAVVASGPTVAPIGGRAEARKLLNDAGLWDQLPAAVRTVLSGTQKAARPINRAAENRLIGSNGQSVAAMAALAPGATVHPAPLVGDVGEAARIICDCAAPGTYLFGGETTVHLKGSGLGGRNQELALRVALMAEKLGWQDDWLFLSGGTDGRDGPTDAAGGLVNNSTLTRMRAAGVDPLDALARNDSYHALRSAGDLLITGATGTNVADLQVLIRG